MTADAIDADRRAGVIPVAVVGTAGTTLTGAVDDLAALGEVCAGRDVWLHADGAYGLPAAATELAGHLFEGIDRIDSATVDAHKWLYVLKACSVLLVRDRDALEATFTHDESYIPHTDREDVHPVDRTLEYSRPLSSLKLWLAFRVHGANAIRAAIERNLRQARLLAELVNEDPHLELLVEPQLSAVCFRHVPPAGADPVAHNAALKLIGAEGRILLAPATVHGIPARACIVNHRTGEDDIRVIVEVVCEAATTEVVDRELGVAWTVGVWGAAGRGDPSQRYASRMTVASATPSRPESRRAQFAISPTLASRVLPP